MHTGREVIYTDVTEFSDENIVEVLSNPIAIHERNSREIDYLYRYYKGEQPVLYRQKKVRPEICNRIVENRANEIVSFKTGFLAGEPIQYVGRSARAYVSKAVALLNEMMFSENKANKDKQLIEWQMICGTAYRLGLPDNRNIPENAPFEIYTLDPRNTFIVRYSGIGNRPLLTVSYYIDTKGQKVYSVYSHTHFWKIKGVKVVESKAYSIGLLPIIEYPANSARLGAFEIVLPLLDAINNIDSNRLDGVEQFVQSFMKFVNCDVDEKTIASLNELGAIKIKSNNNAPADVDIITSELNQSQTQLMKDDLYDAVLSICGMPNRNGGSSTSDTGAAVILRDGWSLAEARAKDSEQVFKESEAEFSKLVLRIIKDTTGLDESIYKLKLADFEPKFTRRNYDNIQSKVQVLMQMLDSDKVHPRLAWQISSVLPDAENAYIVSDEYYREQLSLKRAQTVPDDINREVQTQTTGKVVKTETQSGKT